MPAMICDGMEKAKARIVPPIDGSRFRLASSHSNSTIPTDFRSISLN